MPIGKRPLSPGNSGPATHLQIRGIQFTTIAGEVLESADGIPSPRFLTPPFGPFVRCRRELPIGMLSGSPHYSNSFLDTPIGEVCPGMRDCPHPPARNSTSCRAGISVAKNCLIQRILHSGRGNPASQDTLPERKCVPDSRTSWSNCVVVTLLNIESWIDQVWRDWGEGIPPADSSTSPGIVMAGVARICKCAAGSLETAVAPHLSSVRHSDAGQSDNRAIRLAGTRH